MKNERMGHVVLRPPLGKQIDDYRRFRNIGARKMSRDTGLTPQVLYRVFNDAKNTRIDTILRMADYLGCELVLIRKGERVMVLRELFGMDVEVVGGELTVVTKGDGEEDAD